jgi:hypothetical protein
MVDFNPNVVVEIEEEHKELNVEDIRGQVYRLTGLITQIEGKVAQCNRSLEMSRTLSEKTQNLIDIGISYYDLDSQYEARV